MAGVTTKTLDGGIFGTAELWWSTPSGGSIYQHGDMSVDHPGGQVNEVNPDGSPSGPVASGQDSVAASPAPSGGGGGNSGGGGGGNSGGGGGGGNSGSSVGNAGPIPTSPDIGNTPIGGPISRKEILERARYWAKRGVPYSMSGYTNDPQGKSYRTDCSGLTSMALHLDQSLTTISLRSQVEPINKNDLQPGDIVGNLGPRTGGASGHVMIFAGWVDESKTQFYTIEQTPPKATEMTRTWGSHAYTSAAWRYKNVTD